MSWPRLFAARLRGLFSRGRLESQLADELQFHLDMQIEDNLRMGMNPAEARCDARRRFGGVESMKEQYRESWGIAAIETLLQDVRYAWRTLARSPGFTAVAVMTIAVGMGINATVFTLTNAVLFRGFPLVERNDRILYMRSGGPGPAHFPSLPDFQDWRAQAKSFQGMGACRAARILVGDRSGSPESYEAEQVSANTFRLVGRKPLLGRDFEASDEIPGRAPVAILSYGLWDRRYGKDPAVIGRVVRMNGALTTVIGVMAQGFSFPRAQDLWTPLVATPQLQMREPNLDFVFGRLADGVTVRSARTEMEAIGARLARAYPLTNKSLVPTTQNFNEFFVGSNTTMVYESLWGAAGFVLLIACANLANLMLARSIGRSREISVRIALGAGRWRIVRQLLTESMMLSALGGLAGAGIAKLSVRACELAATAPGDSALDHIFDYAMDYRVLAYLLAISLATGLLFGLAPALRLSKPDLNSALKDGGRGTAGGRGRHLPSVLMIGEMALAVVLLAGAGVMVRSVLNIYTADVGVRTANILTALVQLPDAEYRGAEARISFFQRLKTRLEAVPGVESVATANWFPTWGATSLPYDFAGAAPAPLPRPRLSAVVISPDYFRTLGAPVLSGREFNDADGVSGVPAVIVNERFANRYWPAKNPLGQRLRLYDGTAPEAWLTVVGVVSNIVQTDFTRQEFNPLIYLPYRQKPGGFMNVILRTRVPPASLTTVFRREVYALGSDLPMFGPYTLAERIQANYWSRARYGVLFLIFAVIALLLASIGLYAAIAHSVSRRTQEIGLRMAVGATRGNILKLVFGQGMLPLGIGLIIGLAASFAVNRVLGSLLVQVSPADPVTLAITSATLLLAAMPGCLIPAHRAMSVDPVVALRHD